MTTYRTTWDLRSIQFPEGRDWREVRDDIQNLRERLHRHIDGFKFGASVACDVDLDPSLPGLQILLVTFDAEPNYSRVIELLNRWIAARLLSGSWSMSQTTV